MAATKKEEQATPSVPKAPEAKSYKVTAPFEQGGKEYEAGDRFTPPEDWTLDEGYMTAFAKELAGKPAFATAEVYSSNGKTLLKAACRYVLPLE